MIEWYNFFLLVVIVAMAILVYKLSQTKWEKRLKRVTKKNIDSLIELAKEKSPIEEMRGIVDSRTKYYEEKFVIALEGFKMSISDSDRAYWLREAKDWVLAIKYHGKNDVFTLPPFY